jgi:hypothetical protein
MATWCRVPTYLSQGDDVYACKFVVPPLLHGPRRHHWPRCKVGTTVEVAGLETRRCSDDPLLRCMATTVLTALGREQTVWANAWPENETGDAVMTDDVMHSVQRRTLLAGIGIVAAGGVVACVVGQRSSPDRAMPPTGSWIAPAASRCA